MEIINEVEKQEEIIFSERIRKVRKAIDKSLPDKKLNKERRFIYVHIYGVAQTAAILAKKRGLNVELSIIAGMLHDIYTLVYLDSKKHAHKGAKMAMKILVDLDLFSPVEIAIIYTAIYNHSDKDVVNGVYDELLKDADVLQHVMFDPLIPVYPKEIKRYNRLIAEIGFREDPVPYGLLINSTEEIVQTITEAEEELKVEESLENMESDIEAAVGTTENVTTAAVLVGGVAGTEEILTADTEKPQAQTPVAPVAPAETEPAPAEIKEVPAENEEPCEINTNLSDEEADDFLEAVTANIAVAAGTASIAGMTTSEAAQTYSRDPKQFEAVIDEINQYIEKINRVNSSIDEQNKVNGDQPEAEQKPIVPPDYPVPESYWTDTFYFCKLTPELTELDYEAVMEAREEIRRIYNITDPEEWPNDSLTIEEDREDLIDHEKEFDNRQAFAYSVFNLARKKCFGCFYISPCSKPDHDVFITLWGLNEAITAKLYKDVKKFVYEKFEFKNPAYPAFEIPLDKWEESVNPGAW